MNRADILLVFLAKGFKLLKNFRHFTRKAVDYKTADFVNRFSHVILRPI